jgi:diguanylate cyclase (GGDEF)-like protein/PAS domain S-box-containing protein
VTSRLPRISLRYFELLTSSVNALGEVTHDRLDSALSALLESFRDLAQLDGVVILSRAANASGLDLVARTATVQPHAVPIAWSDVPMLVAKLTRLEPVVVADSSRLGAEWQREALWAQAVNAKSWVGVPVVDDGRCVGFAMAFCHDRREWSDEDIVVLRTLSQSAMGAWRRSQQDAHARRLQERATALVEALPVGVMLTDDQGRATWVNSTARAAFGDRLVPGIPVEALVLEGDRDAVSQEVSLACSSETGFEVEAECLRADGVARWLSFRGAARREGDRFVGHAVTVVDVTDRVLSAEAASRRARYTQQLLRVTRQFVDVDPDAVATTIDDALAILGQYLETDRVVMTLLAHSLDGTLELRFAHDWSSDNLPAPTDDDRIEVTEIPHLYAELRNFRPVATSRIADLPIAWAEERTSAQRRGVRSALWVPIRVHNRLGGALWLNHTTTERDWADVIPTVQIVADVLGDAIDQMQNEDELFQAAYRDGLTKVLNRAGSVDILQRGLAEDGPLGFTTALVFLDLDGFKAVNDTYGHEAGDEVLQQVVQRLGHLIRPSDAVGRLGGDEFVVLCRNVGDPSIATHIGDRIVASLRQPMTLKGATVQIGASVGIGLVDGPQWTADEVLRIADEAMYVAKKNGKNQVSVADHRSTPD